MILLSLDPSLSSTGFAVLTKTGFVINMKEHGLITTKAKYPISTRLGALYTKIKEIIKANKITHIAMESAFMGRNTKTYQKLCYVQAIVYLLAFEFSLEVHNFSPSKVKSVLTYNPQASKEEVALKVKELFPDSLVSKNDVSDAIAVGICGLIELQEDQ